MKQKQIKLNYDFLAKELLHDFTVEFVHLYKKFNKQHDLLETKIHELYLNQKLYYEREFPKSYHGKVNKILSELLNKFLHLPKQLVIAKEEADTFEELVQKPLQMIEIANYKSISALAALFIIKRGTKKTESFIDQMLSIHQSEIAKNKRPNRQHPKKKEVFEYWKMWKAKSGLYKTKAAFIRDMQEKMEIDRAKTIDGWTKEWEGV